MDNFHSYLRKQLLDYVENERRRGIPLDQIEQVLLNAGHQRNIIDEVFAELQSEEVGGKPQKHKNPVEGDLISQLKGAFKQFMAQATDKEVKEAKKDFEETDTEQIVEDVIEQAEVIEEKTMFEAMTFFVYLVAMSMIILFTAAGTGTGIITVFIGFLPALLNAFVSFMAIKLADNVPVYVFIPALLSSAFYAIGMFSGIPYFKGMDVEALSVINFILGFVFNILVVYVRFLKPKSMRRRIIKAAGERPHVYQEER